MEYLFELTVAQACESAIGSAEFYDHSKTEQWNSAIIVSAPHVLPRPPSLAPNALGTT